MINIFEIFPGSLKNEKECKASSDEFFKLYVEIKKDLDDNVDLDKILSKVSQLVSKGKTQDDLIIYNKLHELVVQRIRMCN